tara:strand:+ start:66 stop:1031 length:966 start_codon:yes stop_codon:yes gene_type:complete
MTLREKLKNIENKIDIVCNDIFGGVNTKNTIPIYKSKRKNTKISKEIQKKTTIIFSGGGVKGIVYVGVIRALEESKIINNIDTFVGTSIGSFILSMYLLGYNGQEMYEFITNFDLSRLKCTNILSFFENYGLDKGEGLEYVLKRLIVARGHDENITLKELFYITKKKLTITTVCLNTLEICYMTHENYPDLELYKAVRMSASIPIFYTPVIYKDQYYIDGACMDNYPMNLFRNKLDKVLGFYILSNNVYMKDINNLEQYILRIICSLIEGNDMNCIRAYKDYTVSLFIDNVSSIDFNLNKEQIVNIINLGYDQTMQYILEK